MTQTTTEAPGTFTLTTEVSVKIDPRTEGWILSDMGRAIGYWGWKERTDDGGFHIFDNEEVRDGGIDGAARVVAPGWLQRGLKLIAERYPRRFATMTRHGEVDYDDEDIDVMVQLLVFDRIVYG